MRGGKGVYIGEYTARDIGGAAQKSRAVGYRGSPRGRISKVQREQQRRWKDVLLAQRIETGSERVWLVAKRRVPSGKCKPRKGSFSLSVFVSVSLSLSLCLLVDIYPVVGRRGGGRGGTHPTADTYSMPILWHGFGSPSRALSIGILASAGLGWKVVRSTVRLDSGPRFTGGSSRQWIFASKEKSRGRSRTRYTRRFFPALGRGSVN